jgi:PKD repeat protein
VADLKTRNIVNYTEPALINLLIILVMAIILSFHSTKAFGGQVKLAWDTNAANNSIGYKLKYGKTSGNYTSAINVGNVNTYTVSDLQEGAAYYFAVTAFDSATMVESTNSNEILYNVPNMGVTVNYTANLTTGTAPMVVTFQNTSIGNVTGWKWDFGDSTTSTAQNPVKVYGSPGTYTVSLTATSSVGNLTQTKQNFIQAAAPVALPAVANFTATTTSGTTPLVVSFTNNSSGSINSWQWNFGDGATSTLQAPSHTYNTIGNYTVTLTVSGPGGSSTKSGSISVIAGGSGGTSSVSTFSGLVAAYGFEEASGETFVDASGNGNHGTMKNTNRIANGRFGKALSLDGVSSLITVNDSNSLDLTTGMTMEAWVYNTANTAYWGALLWKDADDGNYGVYYLNGTSPSYGPSAGLLIGSTQYLHGTADFPANAWVHLAATYDGQYQRLYLNGKQVAARAQQGAISKSSGVLRIGADNDGGFWGDCFKGYIDEVRIYNRALTPQEVVGDLNKSVATANPPQPVYGNTKLGPTVDTLFKGTAVASKSVAQASYMITDLNIYLDVGTASAPLIAGVYSDNNGHPGALLTSGTLASSKPGAWNSLTVPPLLQVKGKAYWIALMSPNGTIQFPDYVGTAGSAIESSASHTLTSLPSTWTTGTLTFNGPVSGYGMGY